MGSRFVLVRDTREQNGFSFPLHSVVDKKLDTGDYSIEGFEGEVCVERKTIPELWGLINLSRFRRELERMEVFHRKMVVIEGSIPDALLGNRFSKIPGARVVKTMLRWEAHYGVAFHWCTNRSEAQAVTLRFLESYWMLFGMMKNR